MKSVSLINLCKTIALIPQYLVLNPSPGNLICRFCSQRFCYHVCHLLAVKSWASYLILLSLPYLINLKINQKREEGEKQASECSWVFKGNNFRGNICTRYSYTHWTQEMFISGNIGIPVFLLLPDLEAGCEPESSQVRTVSAQCQHQERGPWRICARVINRNNSLLAFLDCLLWILFFLLS